jgi:LysM repeat protein
MTALTSPTGAIFCYPHRVERLLSHLVVLALMGCGLTGCDRMVTPRSSQTVKDAERKVAEGDFLRAIDLYEGALDGTATSADLHYQMALLYDDKMNDPLNALHHFKRYLTLAPAGSHVAEVKNFMKRDELTLITNLSGDSVVTRLEAARLRNENLSLRKELTARTGQPHVAGAPEKNARATAAEKGSSPSTHAKSSPRSHVVQPGDTLFSLSRQFYNSPDRWKDILEANNKTVEDPGKLKVGQTLTIP